MAEEENKEEVKISEKEERIRSITISYYSRQDIRKAMFEFSKNRECVPRYFEGFGKRPDSFQYESDILELAKKGATSFHCSEEIWSDPFQIATGMSQEELKKMRIGWDLLIDVDSKYLDYSKIYAEILIKVLKAHNIKHIGVKFSGSKGMHIIVPWKAFPKEMSGKKTSEMFPEWPRLICQYLNTQISENLKNRVLAINEKNPAESGLTEIYCSKCNSSPEKKQVVFFLCPNCKTRMKNILEVFERKRKIRCPNCQIEMTEEKRTEILVCKTCNISSEKEPENFRERVKSKHIDADLVLVSPRHLFRMPYSLHEKTSLASVVIDHDKISEFDPREANPMKITPRNFMPDSEEGEATLLLRRALEYKPIETSLASQIKTDNKKDYGDFQIYNLTPELYPPTIKKILEGMKSDGRKRALFILLSFFKSLKLTNEQIVKEIEEWNKKNTEPLNPSYLKGQLSWYAKNPPKMPPNFDKSYYRDIGFEPTPEELASKNPVSYVIKKSFRKI